MRPDSKVLITGSSGMVGSALVRLMRQKGYTNILAPSRKDLDITLQNDCYNFFEVHRPEFVFHLAAKVGGIYANDTFPADFIYQNTQMHSNIFSACLKYAVTKVLFPGSACTYPKMAPQPIKETEFLNGPMEPTNLAYGIAKANGIIMGQSYAKQYGLNVVIPMPANAYGINDNFDPQGGHVIPALMLRFHKAKQDGLKEVEIWGTGNIMREFLYVDDFASGLEFLMNNYNSPNLINLGTMAEIKIIDLAYLIAAVVGFEGKITTTPHKPDGAPRKCLDNSTILSLGWHPNTNLKSGLTTMFSHHFSI